jgi:diacylglycerol O-acyltransferase / wax synthase
VEPLSGLDSTFLAMETSTSRLHVAGILVLEPSDADAATAVAADSDSRRFEAIREVVGERVSRVPRLLRRPVRVPMDLQRPVWVDQPDIDLDVHVRRASVSAPGGQRELDGLIGEVLGRPLPLDRPLWEMVVVDGLAGGRMAVIARLHHAILDGVSGATAMAAFLDLVPGERRAKVQEERGVARSARPPGHGAEPPALALWRHAATSFAHQPDAAVALLQHGADALISLTRQNRDLASRGLSPPPAPFSAPRSVLNGSVTGERRIATLSVPLADLEFVRRVLGLQESARGPGSVPTVNDVILAAVGGALRRYLASRRDVPVRSLVALVPVSTRGPAQVPASGRAHVGNYVSGMLVPLASTVEDPVERLRAVATASAVAKAQERIAGGGFLETLCQAVPPCFVSGFMRAASRLLLFDRLAPPANVVVSSVVVPDVSLWWAGWPVSAIYPAGPVAEGVGLNVTSMTYRGTVHFGVVGCPRLVPDVDEVAVLLDDALAELVAVAVDSAA